MPGINILTDIFNNKGEEFIKNLLNLTVKISEKISGSKLAFELDDNNEFIFFKRDLNNPLNKIDRLISKYYEDGIEYIQSLPDDIKRQLDSKYHFHFEYFPNNKPNYISYKNLPKNKLILTHIRIKPEENIGENNKEIIITDKERLDEWAKKLGVEGPPIIFEGKLNDQQKDQLMEYVRMTKDDIFKKFKTESFTSFIIGILNPEIKKSKLQNDLNNHIEGIVFTFGDSNYQVVAKLVDPFFEELVSKNNSKTEQRSDIIPIIFSDIIEYMEQDTKWKTMKLHKKYVEDRYIELISRMFNAFIDNFGQRYKDITILLPTYLKRPEFELNTMFIENQKTLLFINQSISYKEIFKIFLILFRKKKKKVQEFLSPNAIKYQNKIVDQIYQRITNIDESDIHLYEKYSTEFIEEQDDINTHNYSISDIPERFLKQDIIEEGFVENMNLIKTVSFLQNIMNKPKELLPEKKGKGINIVIGKFQPFNLGHISACKDIYERNNKPIMIIQVNNGIISPSKPFSQELSKKLLTKIVDNYPMFCDFKIINNADYDSIKDILSDQYHIITISGNYNYRRHLQNMINDNDIEFFELKKYINNDKHILNKDIIDMIKNNDYIEFKHYVPESILGYFENMRNEIKK